MCTLQRGGVIISTKINPVKRVERKKENTKQRIISVSIELFRQQGVTATTMQQIARVADIAKGTLYNYFPVKEAIISEYILQLFKEGESARLLKLQNMTDTRSRMIFILDVIFARVQEHKEFYDKFFVYQIKNMISIHRDAGFINITKLLANEILLLGQASGEIRNDLPFDNLVALFEFVFVEIAQECFTKPETFNALQTIENCVDLFMNGATNSSNSFQM